MGDDKGDNLDMNNTEKRELAFSKVVLLLLVTIGIFTVIWLGWFASK